MRLLHALLAVLAAAAVLASCTAAPCPAWDAHGDGLCNLILGAAWDGERCVYISGCACRGSDCDLLHGEDDSLCTMSACNPRPADGGARSP